jgi:hypothetical protein
MPRLYAIAGVCAVLALNPARARAQAPEPLFLAPAPAAVAPAAAPSAPLVGSHRLGVTQPPLARAAAVVDPAAPLRRSLRHRGPGVALMIVGAAGIITGLLIDESIITVVGAGAGLIGLYLYVR